jgi:phage regulator Rha-like protein
MSKNKNAIVITDEIIFSKIYYFREQKVMLDSDLAQLYKVETKRLKEAVNRNIKRFPKDFMFELSAREFESLRSQIASSKNTRGGTRYLPMAFTEQGVTMLSCILNSDRAIAVNIKIIRIFTKIREMLSTRKDILRQIEKIEKRLDGNDEKIATIFEYLKQLLHTPEAPRKRIGFRRSNEKD